MTVELETGGVSHSVTVPRHRAVRIGTISGIVAAVAAHLDLTQSEVRVTLFGR